MQVSYEWLSEFVDLSGIEPKEIAHRLTMSGLEVEDVEYRKPKFTNIITAKILKIDNHPNADKLHLVTVDTGFATKQVVCGAQNIEEGQIIPYASVGSRVFSRKTGELFELTPAVIRGVESQGMLCSCDELGLEGMQDEDGIFILNRVYDSIPLGEPLEKIMNLSEEIIFHVAPTANRGDQMSVVGIAREVSALFNRKLNFNPKDLPALPKTDNFKIEIKDDETCKYYSIGVLKDIEIKPSPAFMQRRIEACGMRAINNVVDITNYILLEYGTPLHAFDYDKLDNYLCVRYAKDTESIITIDETQRKLTNQSVVIAKKDTPVCIAGVFGGLNSEIDDNTKNIALEAAHFTSHTNRKSARSVGYRSEASARFERGVDIELVRYAQFRAAELLQKYANAKVEGMVEIGTSCAPNIEITLRNSEIKRILGIDIPQKDSIEILQNLGFELLGKNEAAAKFKVPSCRVNDVYREIDLIEEVSRIYGYDKITPSLPKIEEGANISFENRTLKTINNLFIGSGFDEIVTPSLVGENLYKEFMHKYDYETSLRVKNPQSEDATMLRQAVMPSILNVVKYNFDNGQKNFRMYEVAKAYFVKSQADEDNSGVEEQRRLAGAVFGSINNELWRDKTPVDFYSVKGVLENLFEQLNLTKRIVFAPFDENDSKTYEFMHPAQSAKISLMGKNFTTLGYVGKIHPILKDDMKFNQDLFVFELNLQAILDAVSQSTVKYKKLPVSLPVTRDIAFALDKDVTNETILKAIKKIADKNIFKGAKVFDIYQGEHIEQGKKSMAYRITLHDESKTLTDEVIDKEMTKIREGLVKSVPNLVLR